MYGIGAEIMSLSFYIFSELRCLMAAITIINGIASWSRQSLAFHDNAKDAVWYYVAFVTLLPNLNSNTLSTK
ncbi:hypothetical protein V1523DRAFT_66575 [Lipomyces doorenjongii]